MATSQLSAPRPRVAAAGLVIVASALLGASLLYAGLYFAGWLTSGSGHPATAGSADDATSSDEPNVVKFEASKWKAAGIRTAPADQGPLLQTLTRPGRIGTHPKKTAQLSPLVEGIVREIDVQRGADVKAGDVLIVLDSKELGQGKLELAKARLALAVAAAAHDWTKTVHQNTADLLHAMGEGLLIADIEKRFTGRAIGEWRQQLIGAYSRRNKAKIDFTSQDALFREGAGSAAALRTAKSAFETADATLQSLREDIQFQNQQQLRAAQEKLRAAQGQVSVAETYLLMVGYSPKDVAAMDPIKEGAKIGHYPIRAAFDGTVLSVMAGLGERVSPQKPVLEQSDLSRVRIETELTEADLPALRQLYGKSITFRGPGMSEPRQAAIHYIGSIVDKMTRTIDVDAYVDNPGHVLKPGMFVDVSMQFGPAAPVVQVLASAIQRQAGETFVFVPKDDDHFERINVRVGRATPQHVEIVEGIAAGQLVVVEGGFALKTEMLRSTLSPE
jgi:multidrug efflux pump subunit AcrA (membrane-fusion protein)